MKKKRRVIFPDIFYEAFKVEEVFFPTYFYPFGLAYLSEERTNDILLVVYNLVYDKDLKAYVPVQEIDSILFNNKNEMLNYLNKLPSSFKELMDLGQYFGHIKVKFFVYYFSFNKYVKGLTRSFCGYE